MAEIAKTIAIKSVMSVLSSAVLNIIEFTCISFLMMCLFLNDVLDDGKSNVENDNE